MSDNYNRDDIPVQDITAEAHRAKSLMMMDKDVRLTSMTMTSSTNIRRGDEFQDRLLQLTDENLFLKKHARKYEDKAKQLEAKLSRIFSEKKYVGRKDDYEVEESRHRIIELEYQMGMMKDRLAVAKQQLVSYTKIFPPHSHSKFKKSKQTGKLSTSASSVGVHSHGSHTHSSHPSNFANSELSEQFEILLMEAKAENQGLENQLHNLRDQLRSLQRELGTTKELLHIKEIAHEDEINLLRSQLGDTDQTKKKLSDNIQLIRLQRDSRRASSWLSTLETQCKTLESNLATSQETGQQLEAQLNSAQEELREVQQQNLNLNKQVEDNLAEISKVKELEAQITSLKDENGILKQANESLQLKAASSAEKVRKVENEEAGLKSQISQMEMTIKNEIKSKTDLYSDVSREKNKCTNLTETLNDLKRKFSAMEVELKRLEMTPPAPASLSVVTFLEPGRNSPAIATASESAVFDESHRSFIFEKGTVLSASVPVPGQQGQPAERVSTISDTCVDISIGDPAEDERQTPLCNYCKTLEKDLVETRSSMGRLHDDLNKTKNLLKGQMSTNRECHKEIDLLSQKLEKADKFHHEKLHEFMKVLEERAAQMFELEKKFELIKNQNKRESSPVQGNAGVISNISHPAVQSQPPPLSLATTAQSLSEKDVNANDQVEIDQVPSAEIFIEKFIPLETHRELVTLKNIFATYEFDEKGTEYSPIVRNGIFNSGSTHAIQNREDFQIEVQIHQAIGPSDCKTLGKGLMCPDRNSCIIQSVTVPPEQLGELKYKFSIRGVKPFQVELKSRSSPSPPLPSSVSVAVTDMESETESVKTKAKTSHTVPANPATTTLEQEQPPVPKPKPRKVAMDETVSTPAAAVPSATASTILSDSESSSAPSTYTITPKTSPAKQSSQTSKSNVKKPSENISVVQSNANPTASTSDSSAEKKAKLTRESKIIVSDEDGTGPDENKLPPQIEIPLTLKTRSASSPKKPILRRESSSPEARDKDQSQIQRKHKRVTVTEIVEERRIPTPTSEDDEKYFQKQRRAAEIATAAATIVNSRINAARAGAGSTSSTKTKQRKYENNAESSGSGSGSSSAGEAAAANNVVVVRPKKSQDPELSEPGGPVQETQPFQIPLIKVQSFDVDNPSSAATGVEEAESSIDLEVLSPAEIVTVKKASKSKSKSKTQKSKPAMMVSTTEIDHSSGSGSGDEIHHHGQAHLVKRTKPKGKIVPSSSTETESSTLILVSKSKTTRRSRNPHRGGGREHKKNVQVSSVSDDAGGEKDQGGDSFEIENISEESSSQDSETYKQTIRIEIAHVIFNSPNRIWSDPKIKKIFVEYRFLDFNPEEMETPNSVAKPQPGKKAEFNFIKIFLIDTRERRKLLQEMLLEKRRIRFTIVSEPPENDSLDCEDIGYAYVPIAALQKEDLVQEQITIYDAENTRLEMGSIYISIQARDVLRTL